MHRKCFSYCVPVIFCAAIAVVGRSPAQDADQQAAAGKSLEDFRQWATAFVAEPHSDLLLPEDWFEQQFEPATAKKLNAEYRQMATSIQKLPELIAARKAKGNTELLVARCDTPIDRKATGLQNAALQQMISPTPLFTLRIVKPGQQKGFALASFVLVDGKFRMAGKFGALNPQPKDVATAILCTTPLEMSEKVLQDRGLIEGSAEEYLKNAGVLE